MQLKTFRASTMADALAQLKRDLGPDAIIIHTRSFRVGSVLGLGGRNVVEITASAGSADESAPRAQARGGSKTSALGGLLRSEAPALSFDTSARRAARSQALQAPDRDQGRGEAHAGSSDKAPAVPTVHRREAHRAVMPEPAATPHDSMAGVAMPAPAAPAVLAPVTGDLEAQLDAIRRLVGQVLQCSRQTQVFVARQDDGPGGKGAGGPPRHAMMPAGSMPDLLFQQYLSLMENEVAGEIADEVVARVRDELSGKDMADAGLVRQSVVRHLAAMLPADPDVARPVKPRDGRPLTIALIGPTGVGKTTTIAKLAATYKLRFGKKIRLITSDTYRIAAVDQLRTYAQIIGVPIDVALTPAEMQAAARNAGPDDVVLIDTAGRSPRDTAKVDELSRFIEATRPHYTHLVVSGTSSPQSMIEAAQRFAAAKPNRIIFTKLDEAVNFGVLVGVARKIDLKLSFFTTGQEVPDHIELARPDRLAKLILDGSGPLVAGLSQTGSGVALAGAAS